MLVVISPAKKLDMQPFDDGPSTQPMFEREVIELANSMTSRSNIGWVDGPSSNGCISSFFAGEITTNIKNSPFVQRADR